MASASFREASVATKDWDVKITKSKIDALKSKSAEYMVWDDSIEGFGVRIYPSGVKTYIFQYKVNGRTRRMALGRHGILTPHNAKVKVIALKNEVYNGNDPSKKRFDISEKITVSNLCDLYLQEGCSHKKPSTIATDIGRIERHIKPLLGTKIASNVTQDDVSKFINDIASGKSAKTVKTKARGKARVRGGNGAARRTVGLLGGIFTFAIRKGLRADNPVTGVTKPKDQKRDRFLTENEFSRLWAFFENPELKLNFNVIPALKLLLLTGCRKSEITTLKWSYIDFTNRYILLPDSKTGAGKIPLSEPAIEVLQSMPKIIESPYVFTGQHSGAFTDLQGGWKKIRKHLNMEDVRIHDLRHSFASILAANGASLLMIGKLLRHSDPKTTEIYAHLVDKQQLQATDEVGKFLIGLKNEK